MNRAYWSLLCFPAALVLGAVGATIALSDTSHENWHAVGWMTLALLMFGVQPVWAHITDDLRTKPLTAGDWTITSCIGTSALLSITVALCPFNEATLCGLTIVAYLIVMLSIKLAQFADWLWKRETV